MNYGCNVADLMKKPESTPEEESRAPRAETYSPSRDHLQDLTREETDRKVRFEDQELQGIISNNVSTLNSLTERKNINLGLLILTINLLLNTNAIKELVFNLLPQAMTSATEYNLLGTLLSGFIISVLVILFISYYY
jgi:hypothetical protein